MELIHFLLSALLALTMGVSVSIRGDSYCTQIQSIQVFAVQIQNLAIPELYVQPTARRPEW
jgi:hypothetical protein